MKQITNTWSGKRLRLLKNQLSMNEKPFTMPSKAEVESHNVRGWKGPLWVI